jgi:hypothetical protein
MSSPDLLDTVPDHLKAKYIPLLKDAFNQLSQLSVATEQCADPQNDPALARERDAFLQRLTDIFSDFSHDGGTVEQWNILAPAVHYDKFGP